MNRHRKSIRFIAPPEREVVIPDDPIDRDEVIETGRLSSKEVTLYKWWYDDESLMDRIIAEQLEDLQREEDDYYRLYDDYRDDFSCDSGCPICHPENKYAEYEDPAAYDWQDAPILDTWGQKAFEHASRELEEAWPKPKIRQYTVVSDWCSDFHCSSERNRSRWDTRSWKRFRDTKWKAARAWKTSKTEMNWQNARAA